MGSERRSCGVGRDGRRMRRGERGNKRELAVQASFSIPRTSRDNVGFPTTNDGDIELKNNIAWFICC